MNCPLLPRVDLARVGTLFLLPGCYYAYRGRMKGREEEERPERSRLRGIFHPAGLEPHSGGACSSPFSSSFPGRAPPPYL